MPNRYADLDVVKTRNGIEVIADLNNMPYLYRNQRHSLNHVIALFNFSKKDTITFTKTVTKNVGRIVRIKVENRKLKDVKPLREISSVVFDKGKRTDVIKVFDDHAEDGEASFKYIDYYTNNFKIVRR